jgi:hypothetical protein
VKSSGFKVIAVVALIAAVVVVLSPIIRRGTDTQPVAAGQGPLVISLAPPAFAQTAGLKFPANEVGISAYVNVGTTVDLAKAQRFFSAIEDATDTYVIGTVPLVGSGEDMWPHVYISKDGWLMAYYPSSEPSSKLFEWYGYQRDVVGTTTLRDALMALGSNLSLDLSKIDTDIAYFHFKYPDATKLLIAVDTVASTGDEFRYTLPSGIVLYDAAWSCYSAATFSASATLDSVSLASSSNSTLSARNTYTICRQVQEQSLTRNAPHYVSIACSDGWLGIAIVFLYR